MRILVVMTGGTIGSVQNGDWLTLDGQAPYTLLEHYKERHPDSDVVFETVSPFTTLSEQLSHEHLNMLIECVDQCSGADFGGVIITHGTDTLQYTAAALQFAFGSDCMPVVLVSSNFPLENRRANGHRNFEAAVAFIRAKSGRGTFVSYKNRDGITRIHRASRLLAHPEYSETILSLDRAPYAVCEDGVIIKNTAYRRGDSSQPFKHARYKGDAGVLTILCRPGEPYAYHLDNVHAVLIRPYHSGTLNTESPAFQAFCRTAAERNIPVFVVGVSRGARYDSTKLFDELSLIILPQSAFVPIYMKLWLGVSLGVDDLKAFALKPLADEFPNG